MRITEVFDQSGGALLIVGTPGTGKTTLVLEIAEELLIRASKNADQPVPVVFPLSTWAVKRESLREWLITELNEKSFIPKRLAVDGSRGSVL